MRKSCPGIGGSDDVGGSSSGGIEVGAGSGVHGVLGVESLGESALQSIGVWGSEGGRKSSTSTVRSRSSSGRGVRGSEVVADTVVSEDKLVNCSSSHSSAWPVKPPGSECDLRTAVKERTDEPDRCYQVVGKSGRSVTDEKSKAESLYC